MKKEPSQNIMGLHHAVVAEDIFYRANEVLEGRRSSKKEQEVKGKEGEIRRRGEGEIKKPIF